MIFFKINLIILAFQLSISDLNNNKEKSSNTLIQISVPLNYIQLNSSQIKRFEHEKSGGYANLLLKDKALYFSGVNYVLKLNSLNINNKVSSVYREREIKPTARSDYLTNETSSNSSSNRIKNHIKFLAFRDATKDLILCGTNLGRPHIYDLKESDLSNQIEYNGDFLCTGVEDLNSLNLIGLDSSHITDANSARKGLIYSAIWITESISKTYGIFSRYGIFRKDIEINRNFVRSLFSPYWLWEPNFIRVIEDSKYVYFFFTEFSVEEFTLDNPTFDMSSLNELSQLTLKMNQTLPRFSRVARVCKNDQGVNNEEDSELNKMWTTFRKIKLQCKCSNLKEAENNSKIFNYLYESQVYSMDFNNLVFVRQLENVDKLVAVFHEKIPNFYKLEDDLEILSVLCEFDLDAMRSALETRKFWQRNVNADELNFAQNDFGCESVLMKEEETDQEFLHKEEENQKLFNFLSKNSILNSVLIGECKTILPYKVTSLTQETKSTHFSNETILYFSTSNGKIIRVSRNNQVYQVLSIISLDSNNSTQLSAYFNEILFNSEESIVYLTTDKFVYQLNLSQVSSKICSNYMYCSTCLSDPYCRWEFSNCLSRQPSFKEELNNNCNFLNSSSETTQKINSNFVNKEATSNENLIINCADYLESGEVSAILTGRIDWFKNGVKIGRDGNERVSRSGELIVLNVSHTNSGMYVCKLDTLEELLLVNLTVKTENKKKIDSKKTENEESDKLNEHYVHLWEFFAEWKNELKNYKFKMNELENFFNQTLECEC